MKLRELMEKKKRLRMHWMRRWTVGIYLNDLNEKIQDAKSNRDKQGEKVYELDKRKTENKW